MSRGAAPSVEPPCVGCAHTGVFNAFGEGIKPPFEDQNAAASNIRRADPCLRQLLISDLARIVALLARLMARD